MSQAPQSSGGYRGGNAHSARGRGRGGYQARGGQGGRAQGTPYQPPTPEQQRFLAARNTLRNALEEVDVETGRSMVLRQPRVEGQPDTRGRLGAGGPYTPSAQMQNGLPASHVTPHVASQPQLAQHGASVVRSSVVSVPQGAVHFFSSIQKRGGAFTTSERETYDQLRRSGAISKDRGMRNLASKYAGAVKTTDIERRFSRMAAERSAEDFSSALRKRHRFDVSDSDSMSASESAASDEDAVGEEGHNVKGADADATTKSGRGLSPDA